MSRCAISTRERRSVDDFVCGDAGKRAAGDIADHVAAGALGREADGVERVHDLGERLDGEPVELDVLADCDVGEIARVFACEAGDDAELAGGEDAVGDADAHHEVIGGEAFAALAAGCADAVALGVDAPPFEVERGPLGHHAGAAFARKVRAPRRRPPRGSCRASDARRVGPWFL